MRIGDWSSDVCSSDLLVPEESAIQRVADYREAMLAQQIYPLCFVWKTDFWTTLGNILKDAARPRSEGLIEMAKDLLLDRLDDTLEQIGRASCRDRECQYV